MKTLHRTTGRARAAVTALAAASLLAVAGATYASNQAEASTAPTPAPAYSDGRLPVAMSAEARKEYLRSPLVRVGMKFYAGMQSGQFAPFAQVLAANWKDTPLGPGQGPGLAGWQSQIEYLHQALPDLRVHIDAVHVQGDTISVRETFSGHQRGTFLGVAPTGRYITFRASDMHTVHGNRITASWHLEDQFGAYQQITAK